MGSESQCRKVVTVPTGIPRDNQPLLAFGYFPVTVPALRSLSLGGTVAVVQKISTRTLMIMADVLKIFLLILGALLLFVAYWLAAQALFPGFVARAREGYGRPWRALGVGLVCAVPFVLLALALFKNGRNPVINIVGVVSLAIPVLLGLFGSSGLAQRIGVGMPSPLDEQQPWRRTLRGGIVLSLTFLLPFIGWFGLIIGTLVSGVGAAVLAIRGRHEAEMSPPLAGSLPPITS